MTIGTKISEEKKTGIMTITFDGVKFEVPEGLTVLEAALKAGVYIPTLCYLHDTSPTGACRICVVEVKGARTLVASCAAPAAHNMEVKTNTERVLKSQRLNLELVLASGHHYCVTCEADGDCRLQDLAYRYRIENVRFHETPARHPREARHPRQPGHPGPDFPPDPDR